MNRSALLLLALLFCVTFVAQAAIDPQISRTDPAANEAARLEAANAPDLPPSAWEYPPAADTNLRDRLGYDISTTHYARGRTLIVHIFINHPGVAWTADECAAAAGRSNVAKDYYMNRSPYAANMSFDDPGSYVWYNPTINWVIPDNPTQQQTYQAEEDATAAIGFTDANGNGTRADDMTLYLQNWDGGWDNVICVFEPHVPGRAFSDFYVGRCVLYTNSGGSVWAHEWGHNYHACDEYSENGHCWNCDCGPCTEGFYLTSTVDNGNCALASCPLNTSCVMKYNSAEVAPCVYTTGQWSWTDGDTNGLLDEVKRITGSGTYVWIYEMFHAGAFYWNNVTDGIVLSQRWNNWYVAGVRPPATADYDITLYGDNKHDFPYASSTYGTGVIDFVVGDCNHSPIGNEHIQLSHYSGDWAGYNVTWEGGDQMLFADGIQRSEWWWVGDVVRVWDVPLNAGETITFNLTNSSANLDVAMALFKSNGAPYWGGRPQAQWQKDVSGVGGGESYTYTVPSTDVYGLVVWSNNAADGWIELQIGPTPTTMAESTVYTSTAPLALYNYDPYAYYWAFAGSRAIGSNNLWLGLYDDANYTQQLSSISWDGSPLKFFAADYNDGYSRDYLRVIPGAGTTSYRSQWEQGSNIISGIEQVWWTSPYVGMMWDARLSAGTTYFFREYHDPSSYMDTGIYLFSSSDGDRFKNSTQASAISTYHPGSVGGEWFTYTPAVTDWYGVCETVANEMSGPTSLWMGPRFTFAESGWGSLPDRVIWGNEPVDDIYWNAFGARAQSGETVALDVYSDDAYTTANDLAGDSGHRVALVFGDFNHNTTGTYYSRTYRENGSGSVAHEWDGGPDALTFIPGGSNNYTLNWGAGAVVEIWDIYVRGNISGGQSMVLEVTDLSGSMDLGLQVLSSYGHTTFWGNRSSGFSSDQSGVGGTESLQITFLVDDWFGLAVWNNNDAGGSYRIRLLDPASSEVAEIPASAFDLGFVGPNPFRASLGLQYSLTRPGPATLTIYDLQGRRVRALVNETQGAGVHGVVWDGRDEAGVPVGSGIYFARLASSEGEKRVKLVCAR